MKTYTMPMLAVMFGMATLVPAAAQAPVFPSAVDAKFEKLRPTQARMKTCAAQYQANKAADLNGGLKWLQKGGGYWSQCNKALKGSVAQAKP